MGVFHLQWLRGPGQSRDENFEILCLELLSAEHPQGQHRRLGAPDHGVDILGVETKDGKRTAVAYQCKAYGSFTNKLVAALRISLRKALDMKAGFESLTWEAYSLITPLLLTAGQRESLEAVWKEHGLDADIRDIDWIEKLLYRHGDVRSRFFPEFQLLFPPENATVDIGFPECSEMCELYLFVKRFQQGIRLRVPAELTVGGVVELLIDRLDLPRKASVRFLGSQSFNAVWALHRSDGDLALDSQQTFKSLGLPPGTQVELVGTFQAGLTISYMGGGGRHKRVAVNDKSQGWIARRINHQSEIEEFISEMIGRRLGALFPGRAAPAATDMSLSDVIRAEEDEDRRLPPKHLVLKVSDLQFTFLAHAVIEFGSGFSIDDFRPGRVCIDKEKMGDVMEAYGAFHRVLEAKRADLSRKFNDIDDVSAQSRHLKTELLNHCLWIGPGPGSVTFSRRRGSRITGRIAAWLKRLVARWEG